jgi:hypothetical protein
VSGNTMSVRLDGTPLIDVPDLDTAVAAAGTSSGVDTPLVPSSGGYGFRAWSQSQVTLQQMTVTGAG